MKTIGFTILASLMGLSAATAQTRINLDDTKQHIGQIGVVCGKVFSGRYLQSAANKPTLLNMGDNYPNQKLTVVIFEDDRKYFPTKPEEYFINKNVCVTGKIQEYRNIPEIIIRTPEQIVLEESSSITSNSIAVPNVKPEPKQPTADKPKKETPPTTQTASASTASDTYEIKISNDVNVRTGPGKDHPIATILKAGSVVTVLSSSNGWSYVNVKYFSKEQSQNIDIKGFIKNSVLQ